MRNIFLIAVALISFSALNAQQEAQFSQNMFNRLFSNPGYAGARGKTCFTLLAREQWTGYEGQPTTGLVSFNTPWKLVHGGVGGAIYSDQIGPIQYLGGKFAYAFRQALSIGDIGIGASFGAFNTAVDGDNWVTLDDPERRGEIDQTLQMATDFSNVVFDMNFGVYFNTNKLYAGISTSQITQGNVGKYSVARHYFIQGGYIYDLNQNISIQPSTFIKTDGVATQVDINVSALYRNMIWGGVTYRFQDAIAPIVGFFKDIGPNGTLRVGYSYDLGINQLNSGHNGSHELMLNYCFKIVPPVKVQRHRTVLFL